MASKFLEDDPDETPPVEKRTNKQIADALEEHFRPMGIVAYSMCCRMGCTGSYDEDDPDWKYRDNGGLTFFKLFLGGGNYYPEVPCAFVQYDNWEYLDQHWEEEMELIRTWCGIVGTDNFEVVKPEGQQQAVQIRFDPPLQLEKLPDDGEEEEEEEEEDTKGEVLAS